MATQKDVFGLGKSYIKLII